MKCLVSTSTIVVVVDDDDDDRDEGMTGITSYLEKGLEVLVVVDEQSSLSYECACLYRQVPPTW